MSKPVIEVENLGKAYRIGLKEEVPDTIVSAAAAWAKSPLKNLSRLRKLNTFGDHADADDVVWALKDVSFTVNEGEVVGVIGRNGAGKSTLLKILSRITEPTHGRAVLRGRVSSLLEVGTGFHPELTGRDNVYMNGTILGMTKREIDRKFDEIVDFSGVEKYLDTPVKRYSSGMKVRLAFAVAAHLEPEILIIDEVLAVGDAEFQRRCMGKMQSVAAGGRTVLFVSHNMAAVERLCSRGVFLRAGRLATDSNTSRAISAYHAGLHVVQELQRDGVFEIDGNLIRRAEVLGSESLVEGCIPLGGPLRVRLGIAATVRVDAPRIGIGIDSELGQRMLTIFNPVGKGWESIGPGECDVEFSIPQLPLAPGRYWCKVAFGCPGEELESADQAFFFDVVDADTFGNGRSFHRGACVAPSEWSRSITTTTKDIA